MVASSVQLNAGKVGLCDLTPHRSLGINAELRPGCVNRAVVHSNLVHMARVPRCGMPHISAKGSRKTGVTSYYT